MLTVCTWLWGDKFDVSDVVKLFAGVDRHLRQPHRLVLVTDDPRSRDGISDLDADVVPIAEDDLPLTEIKGCFARLRMFDPMWQFDAGVDDRVIGIDIDTIITGPLDPLFDRTESFVIMHKGNASNPCPFNGAMQMLRAGAYPEVWSDFSLEAASKVPFYEIPDDQGWIWHKLPHAAGWTCGSESGVYVYQKPGWPGGKTETNLPAGARLVTFIKKTPRDVAHLDWVKEHWR